MKKKKFGKIFKIMKEFVFRVNKKYEGYKVVDFLKERGVSLELVQKIKRGGVFVNGKVLLNINDLVKNKDKVKIILPKDEANKHVIPVREKLKVLYEDEYLIAVVKESGVITHSAKYNESPSLEQKVCGYFLPDTFTFRPINRLDKDTSGIVLIAKDEFTASLLNEKIRNGKIKKTYRAIVKGIPQKRHFIIEQPIKRQSENSIKRVCDEAGQYAKTECRLKKVLDNGLSMLEIKPHTGRTHQIRVHLSHEGYPLYADALYGEKVIDKTFTLIAYRLEFIHPFTNKKIKITI